MKLNKEVTAKTDLESGQLWQVGEFHIEIVQLGKTLCHYRHLRNLNQKGIPGSPSDSNYANVGSGRVSFPVERSQCGIHQPAITAPTRGPSLPLLPYSTS